LEILEKITSGNGEERDLVELENLGDVVKTTSLCGLGQSAPNPILSTLHYFRDEYLAHVRDKRCPAGVCTKMIRYKIVKDKCIGCTQCTKVCPASCITGVKKAPHKIEQSRCQKCGACVSNCKFDAIVTD
jgi:Pyruvate/2-oxoacid:ferredoxin oxidoreductase delta subunit